MLTLVRTGRGSRGVLAPAGLLTTIVAAIVAVVLLTSCSVGGGFGSNPVGAVSASVEQASGTALLPLDQAQSAESTSTPLERCAGQYADVLTAAPLCSVLPFSLTASAPLDDFERALSPLATRPGGCSASISIDEGPEPNLTALSISRR